MPAEAYEKTILHVDMDAFFAAVEQRDHPEWRGRPVVVGSDPHSRGVVAAASYEARRFGIHSAMPSREAYRRCPQAVFVPCDMARYRAASHGMLAIFERYTPWVEPLSIDEAFLDVTGAFALFGDGFTIAQHIRADIRRELALTASVGIAGNKFLAKIASDLNKPDGLAEAPRSPHEIAQFLAPMPVGRLWGVGKVWRARLEEAGFMTIGDIQAASLERLSRLLGSHSAAHLHRLSVGADEREVETTSVEKSISREHTFAHDTRDRDEIMAKLGELAVETARALRAAQRRASTLVLKIRFADFSLITRRKTLGEPICDDMSARSLALAFYQSLDIKQTLRLIGVGFAQLSPDVAAAPQQMELFDTPAAAHGASPQQREKLMRAVDDIRRRYGDDSIHLA